jgi:hypothetical protein
MSLFMPDFKKMVEEMGYMAKQMVNFDIWPLVTTIQVPSFYEHPIYEFMIQSSMSICTYFSLNELHFHFYKQLKFVRSATFTCKEHGNLVFNLQIFTS